MQENEKYGIELEAKTSLFKKGMQEAIKYTKAFGQGVKESFVEQTSKIANNWRSAFKEAFTDNGYLSELKNLKQRYAEISEMKDYKGKEDDKAYLEGEIARVQALVDGQQDYNEELEKTDKISHKTSISLGGLFDRSISKIKRFTFYLLGARSVFSLFMKYQGIYYQYNEQMRYQSELSQNAIALSLAPAFEFLGNVITYASIGFAKFIELLTGVNVLSKVSTKGIRDYNKSLKESQSLLSGIDEITNLTLPSSTGLADQYKALDDFQKKVKEVEEFFKKNKWIEDLADGLKKAWEWLGKIYNYIKDNWDIFKYIIGGAVITSFLGFALGGTGVGTMTLVATLTLIGIAQAFDEIKKLKDEIKGINQGILSKWPETFDKIIDRIKKTKIGTKDWKEQTNMLHDATKNVLTNISTGKLKYEEYGPIVDDLIGKLQDLDADEFSVDIDLLMYTKTAKEEYDDFIKYATGGNPKKMGNGKIEGATIDYDMDVNTTNATKQITNFGDVGTNSVQNIIDKIKELTGIKIEKKTTELGFKYTMKKSDLDALISKVRSIAVGMLGMPSSIFDTMANSVKKKFGYKNGLDYVPYDNYPALLHKGEAVVPAKYNTTIHSVGNEYTNSLLETLVMKIDDLAQRPNVFEIDGQKFANATYDLYDNARSRQNYVEGVVR